MNTNLERCKKWREKNKEKYLKYKREWAKNKYKNNPNFRIREKEKERKRYLEDIKYRNAKKERTKNWIINNRERFNILMMNAYKNNIEKNNCRNKTYNIIHSKNGYKKRDFPTFMLCKKCGTNKDLQIHHEIYLKSTKEILKAIKDQKIICVCRKCHWEI
jgi:hypothetical protein